MHTGCCSEHFFWHPSTFSSILLLSTFPGHKLICKLFANQVLFYIINFLFLTYVQYVQDNLRRRLRRVVAKYDFFYFAKYEITTEVILISLNFAKFRCTLFREISRNSCVM
jgi:hypothetical protein